MDLLSIYVANGTGIFILLILFYASRTKILRDHIEDRIYSFIVLGVMLACFMEAFSYTLDGRVFPCSRFLNYVANTYLYTVNLLLPFCVLVYVDLGLYGDMGRIWKQYRPQIIVGAVMLSVTFLNFFVPIAYYITDQNVYERRPLSYVYYFVILYYCITAIRLTKRYERENGARPFFSIKMFLVPILVGAGLQFLFYGLSLAWLSSAIGLVGLYMMQQNEIAYIDPLVDTYNRQYLNFILAAWISRGKGFTGIMLDIDRFKSINDSFGHSEGDRALRTVAEILKNARTGQEWVFRFAGDEFVVLKMTPLADDMAGYLDAVERGVDEYNASNPRYPLALSYGVSHFETGDVDAFMRDMDERMYAMKAEHHGKA